MAGANRKPAVAGHDEGHLQREPGTVLMGRVDLKEDFQPFTKSVDNPLAL